MSDAIPNERWRQRFTSRFCFVRVSRTTGLEVGRISTIRADGSSITRNIDTDTKESAKLKAVGRFDVGNDLIRCYFTPEWADGFSADIPLGTWLPSAPTADVDGYKVETDIDCSSRLQELKDDMFDGPLTIAKGTNAVQAAADICKQCGLDVVADESSYHLSSTWTMVDKQDDGTVKWSQTATKLDAVNDLLQLASFGTASVDGYGRIVMSKYVNPGGRGPIWYFTEGPHARFERAMSDEYDIGDVANVVRVVYSNQESEYIGTAVDDDPASPFSTVSLGRRIVASYSYTDLPDDVTGTAAQRYADSKAEYLLNTSQAAIRRITFSHVYAPVTVNDPVAVQYPSGGVDGTYVIRTQDLDLSAGGLLTKSEARRYVRRSGVNAG